MPAPVPGPRIRRKPRSSLPRCRISVLVQKTDRHLDCRRMPTCCMLIDFWQGPQVELKPLHSLRSMLKNCHTRHIQRSLPRLKQLPHHRQMTRKMMMRCRETSSRWSSEQLCGELQQAWQPHPHHNTHTRSHQRHHRRHHQNPSQSCCLSCLKRNLNPVSLLGLQLSLCHSLNTQQMRPVHTC